jgi:hypothetical protein
MLLFRQRPDVIFCDLAREALTCVTADLKANDTDPHVMSILMPRVGPVLSRQTGLATVEALRTALDTADVYELEPMHRLLLAEALKRYCESYNDQPQESALYGRYEIPELNCERLVSTFLGHVTAFETATLSVCPGEVSLQLYLSTDAPWHSPLPEPESPWFRRGIEYPLATERQHNEML